VQFADPYHHFVKVVGGQVVFLPGLMAAGGIHPTPAGYQVLARVYTETIRTAIGR
jgi:lysophospholipase L1-like esterase